MMCGLGTYYGTLNPAGYEAMSRVTRTPEPPDSPRPDFLTSPGKTGSGYGFHNLTIGTYPEWKKDSYLSGHDAYVKLMAKSERRNLGGPFMLGMHPIRYFDDNPYRVHIQKKRPRVRPVVFLQKKPPFMPSSPAKLVGGMMAGTFSQYPAHAADTFFERKPYYPEIRNKFGKAYLPPSSTKSMVQNSILGQNVLRQVNKTNYKTIKDVMAYRCVN
jgi:hypothetical protein